MPETELPDYLPADPPESWCPTEWDGPWRLTTYWATRMPIEAKGDPVWFRYYLYLDGHEICCHHTDFVLEPVR